MRACSYQALPTANHRCQAASLVPHQQPHLQCGSPHTANTQLPQTRPRSPLSPSDPQLVRQLRAYLLRATQRPPGVTEELVQLLQSKLAVGPQEVQDIFHSSTFSTSTSTCSTSSTDSLDDATPSSSSPAAASDPAISSSSFSTMQPQLQELERGLDELLLLFSPAELLHLLQQQPALLFAPLASWCAFFSTYGFSPTQTKNLISQTHGEVLTKGTLVTAGAAIMHLKSLGFDNDEIRHRVVAYCPQVLAMSADDISVLIRLWEKFKGVSATP